MPPSPKGASLVITIHPELGFTSYMAITTLQQVIDERISFLKEQINPRIRYNYTKKTTMLMYNALRNHPLLKEPWTVLIKEGLLTYDDTTQTFKTTEKGLRFLESIAK